MKDRRTEFEEMLLSSGGFYTVDDILRLVGEGKMQSFAHGDTWVLTQVHEFPRKKVVEISYVIGDMDAVLAIQERINEFAKEIGASLIIASGRPGWEAVKTDGWKKLSVNYVRDVQ